MTGTGASLLPLWVAMTAILSLLIGTASGGLEWFSSQKVARAILTGGAAAGATMTLGLLVINTLS